MNINRRRFLQGTAALFAAPAIVKADSIMRIDSKVIVREQKILTINPTDRPFLAMHGSGGELHEWHKDELSPNPQLTELELERMLREVWIEAQTPMGLNNALMRGFSNG